MRGTFCNGTYVPPMHKGTREEIIKALLDEAADIDSSCMRMFAIDRELNRIMGQLRELGVDLYRGTDADEGHFLGRERSKPHGPTCNMSTGECNCKFDFRSKEIGSDDDDDDDDDDDRPPGPFDLDDGPTKTICG